MDIAALKAQLAASSDRLVVELLGQPTAQGARYWRWGSRGSLSYDVERHTWHSFEADQGGDLLDLIQFANPGWDFRQAIEWAGEWLGAPVGVARDRAAHAPAPSTRRTRLQPHELALQLWREARPASGTIVETYLRHRGLKLPDGSDEVLRFHPACPRGEARSAGRCSA